MSELTSKGSRGQVIRRYGIVGYDAVTGYPLVDITEHEEAYLYDKSVSEVRSQETAESTSDRTDTL